MGVRLDVKETKKEIWITSKFSIIPSICFCSVNKKMVAQIEHVIWDSRAMHDMYQNMVTRIDHNIWV